MSHLGVYYAPEHARQSDRDFIAALQPPVVRILEPDVQHLATVHQLAPDAILLPRLWTIDDNGGQAVRDLMADPIVTGRKHADQYRARLIEWYSQASQRGLVLPPSDRILFSAANEPNQGGTPDKIAAYNVAFLDQCKINGLRAAALCLGVGWPDNTGPDTPVNWRPYAEAGLPEAIRRGNHWLELHEYFYKSGPQDGWRWLAGRHLQCPFDVPILLGEIGCDNYVDKARWDREGGNRGWQGNMSADTYADMITYHISHSDRRVVAALPFITDYRNNEWQSFDTNAAHAALLERRHRMIPEAAPVTTHLPTVAKPAQEPQPTPQADNWSRSRAFIAKWEGGYQNIANDRGNWTGGAVGVGELKGTKYGISAASYPNLDIKNLTLAQADAIYFKDFWVASDADKLSWPACLLVFDTAVLHGVGTAQRWLDDAGPNPYVFAARRLRSYTKADNFDFWGKAWVLRVADLLEAMAL